ncbi:TonB family protein [Salinispirillum sp. LH 10-3-1]|uniref:TonB family protein n=1 Tax=Salinispirillum sp. LH 10-3-1 TaxID=2952525 RepID=A0AB38YIE5_9GAMM
MNSPVDMAEAKTPGRSRLNVALFWSLLGHAVAAGVVWQYSGTSPLAVPHHLSPPVQVVQLRTEAPPPAAVPVDWTAEPAVTAEQGWLLPSPAPSEEEIAEVHESIESREPPALADPIERTETDAAREQADTIADAVPEKIAPDPPESSIEHAHNEPLETYAEQHDRAGSDGTEHDTVDVAWDHTMAAVVDDVMATYRAELQRALRRVQTYPRRAQRLNLEGVAHVRFHIDAAEGITAAELVVSSGHRVLDDAARTMLSSLTELPTFPAELQARQIHALSFEVPIEYRLN